MGVMTGEVQSTVEYVGGVEQPGFPIVPPPITSSGLQNMADRVEAAGGRVSVESGPGAGTWVRAEVPVPATVTALRDGAGSP
jgi:signal transduction histidine kinase